MPAVRRARLNLRGTIPPAQSRQREAACLDSLPAMWSMAARCQSYLVAQSEGGLFRVAQRNESWPRSRLFNLGSARSSRLSRQFPIRRNAVERPRRLQSGSCSGVERSESWRVRPCAGQTVPGLARRQDRLGAAGFRFEHRLSAIRGARSARFPVESRSDEVSCRALVRPETVERRGRVDWRGDDQTWCDVIRARVQASARRG